MFQTRLTFPGIIDHRNNRELAVNLNERPRFVLDLPLGNSPKWWGKSPIVGELTRNNSDD